MFEADEKLLLAHVSQGSVRVLSVTPAGQAICGYWQGRQLVDALSSTLELGPDPWFTAVDIDGIDRLRAALVGVDPGLLEGLLASFLFGLDVVDHVALGALRDQETGVPPRRRH